MFSVCRLVSRRCHDISTIPLERTTSGSPGVNTYLCAHGRRVYLPGLRWIEDFALCCRLIPPGPPNSVLVHRPMRLRHPALAERLPPEVRCRIPRCAAATSFASIKLDQGLAVGEASHAEAHPLEYVPCPAHNKSVKRTAGASARKLATPPAAAYLCVRVRHEVAQVTVSVSNMLS